jgi:hypothetical protein
MRVTIEHREQATGITQSHKQTYIDCSVTFSEEERAIIEERDLYQSGFSIRTSTPMPTTTAVVGTGFMRIIGSLMMVVGVVWGIAGGGTPTGLLFFGGLGLFVWSWFRARVEDRRMETSEQYISLKQLLAHPTFTVHAWDPAAAKNLDQEIRDDLTALKSQIQNSAALKEKQSFEL